MTITVTDLPPRLAVRIDFDGPIPPNPSRPLDTGCWLWTGGLFPAGYGSYWSDGKSVLVHRYVYEQLVGPLPDRDSLDWVDHICRVRGCCRPDHLEVVTATENQLRREDHLAEFCPNGHPWAENAVPVKDHPNQRSCRSCNRDKARAHRARKAAL